MKRLHEMLDRCRGEIVKRPAAEFAEDRNFESALALYQALEGPIHGARILRSRDAIEGPDE